MRFLRPFLAQFLGIHHMGYATRRITGILAEQDNLPWTLSLSRLLLTESQGFIRKQFVLGRSTRFVSGIQADAPRNHRHPRLLILPQAHVTLPVLNGCRDTSLPSHNPFATPLLTSSVISIPQNILGHVDLHLLKLRNPSVQTEVVATPFYRRHYIESPAILPFEIPYLLLLRSNSPSPKSAMHTAKTVRPASVSELSPIE